MSGQSYILRKSTRVGLRLALFGLLWWLTGSWWKGLLAYLCVLMLFIVAFMGAIGFFGNVRRYQQFLRYFDEEPACEELRTLLATEARPKYWFGRLTDITFLEIVEAPSHPWARPLMLKVRFLMQGRDLLGNPEGHLLADVVIARKPGLRFRPEADSKEHPSWAVDTVTFHRQPEPQVDN